MLNGMIWRSSASILHINLMGFSYSITYGIAAGFITYTFVKIVRGQAKEVHAVMWVLDVLFILNFVSLAISIK